eukprot:SAG31_NODE_1655_length_7621_cov_3.211912_1_plen_380_part_00
MSTFFGPAVGVLRQVLMRGEEPPPGSVLADEAVPAHETMDELAEMAGNHNTPEGKQLCAKWGAMCAAVEGNSKESLPVNRTGPETEAALEAIGGRQLRVYTDGGADGNGAKGVWGAAGWGVHVIEVATGEAPRVRADLWGPVVTDENDEFFCGANKGTNNTGELCGIGQGLMWLRDVAANATLSAPEIVNAPAVMLYDSGYAANIATGRWKANANEALAAWVRRLLVEVEATGRVVHWVHVKGHSADGGNDAADERVQWGKESGPYARLRNGGGEGDSRFGAMVVAEGEIELDSALEALLDDADALVDQATYARWRAADDAALYAYPELANAARAAAARMDAATFSKSKFCGPARAMHNVVPYIGACFYSHGARRRGKV